MLRPKIRKRKRDENADATPERPPVPDYSHFIYNTPTKRSRVVKAKPTFFVGDGRRYVQRPNLSIPRGQVGMLERPLNWNILPAMNQESDGLDPATIELAPMASLHHRKREAQNQRWINEVIPRILGPYMALLRQTNNLNSEPAEYSRECTCLNPDSRVLEIRVVRMYSAYMFVLVACSC